MKVETVGAWKAVTMNTEGREEVMMVIMVTMVMLMMEMKGSGMSQAS